MMLRKQKTGKSETETVVGKARVKPARSKLAEVLGVEEDEEWEAYSAVHRIHRGKREIKRGQDWVQGDNEAFLAVLINNPSQIKRLPRQRLTEPEIAIMRVMNAKYVTRLDNSTVGLWGEKPDCDVDAPGNLNFTLIYRGEQFITKVSSSLFPSVKPGECIGVEEKI